MTHANTPDTLVADEHTAHSDASHGPINIEIEFEGRLEPVELEIVEVETFLEVIRDHLGVVEVIHIFERDQDEPLEHRPPGRRAMRLVAHRARKVEVHVRYEHREEKRFFAPAKSVFTVLQWAVSKHAFDLDPMAAAKANLILPGADAPLPREDVIGKYVMHHGPHVLVVDLTLKDFTNG
jgi:hypothetical protein